jgi:hypothetical protein
MTLLVQRPPELNQANIGREADTQKRHVSTQDQGEGRSWENGERLSRQYSYCVLGRQPCPRLPETARAVAVFALIAKKDQRVRFNIRKVGFDCTVFPQVNTINEAVAADTASHSHQ